MALQPTVNTRISFKLFLICGFIFLSSCSGEEPLNGFESRYFEACQRKVLSFSEIWIETKIATKQNLGRKQKQLCECQARGFFEVLTLAEYKKLIKAEEVMADAFEGKAKDDEIKAVNFVSELTGDKVKKISSISEHCLP